MMAIAPAKQCPNVADIKKARLLLEQSSLRLRKSVEDQDKLLERVKRTSKN